MTDEQNNSIGSAISAGPIETKALAVKPPVDRNEAMITQTGLSQDQMKQVMESMNANIDASDLKYSRAAILQPLSPEIVNRTQGYTEGMIVDNVTREPYSRLIKPPWLRGRIPDSEIVERQVAFFLPVFKLPSEYIKWKNRQTEGAGWHFKTLDVGDPKVREGIWPPKGIWKAAPDALKKSPPVTENINILGLMLSGDTIDSEVLSPFLVDTFSKTSFDTGRNLLTACNQHGLNGLPWWGRLYYIYTDRHTGDGKGAWYTQEFAKGPAIQRVMPHLLPHCAAMAMQLSDPVDGRKRQETVINAAVLDEGDDEAHAAAGADVGGVEDQGFDPFSAK